MGPKALFDLLKEAFGDWKEDKASRLAAALAYYTAFSLAPMVLIAIAVAGLAFGDEAAQGAIFAQLQGLLGGEAAGTLETAVQNSRKAEAGILSAAVGLALLLWSASGLFAQLQDALNTIWEVQPKPGAGILATIRKRFLSMTMVLGIGFILLVSLVLSAGLAALGRFFGGLLPGGEAVWQAVNFVISFGVITLLFAAIYKVLPDAEIAWRDVWVGAAATAVLFTVGKLLIGLYLGHASVGSTYGAAGSLLVLLVWVYYSAQILFFGAEFTQVYARRFGSRIVPDAGAVALTPDARAQQGMPRQGEVEQAAGTSRPADGRATEHRPASAKPAPDAPRDGGAPARNPDGRGGGIESEQVKTVLWAGLSAGSMALTGLLARRASASLWQKVTREPPPTRKA